ncbi:MAG: ankyrin repeat domain-containing protein [Alphaproteobacteria bacterium]|nr:ankyrin repeat domain-containing protein [Alphaproteobacteria bacterium]
MFYVRLSPVQEDDFNRGSQDWHDEDEMLGSGDVKKLIEEGRFADWAAKVLAPMVLMDAIGKNDLDTVNGLIGIGTDVTFELGEESGIAHCNGPSPLMLASQADMTPNGAIVQALLDAGADKTIDFEDAWGETALALAARHNMNPKIITLLANAGATVNWQDDEDCTPIMCAARYNTNPAVAETLLGHGAHLDGINRCSKETIWDYAAQNPNSGAIMAVLNKHREANNKTKTLTV